MLIGYARVSTQDQNLDLQQDALQKAGCEKIYEEKKSGVAAERAELDKVLSYLRENDTLVVWKLDRLGRSLKQLIEIVSQLEDKNIGFRSIQENIDTTQTGGKLIFHVFGALAEFERDIIRERTMAGIIAARERGRRGGRPRVMDDKKIELAVGLMNDPSYTVREVCSTLNVSKATLYRYLSKHKVKKDPPKTINTEPVQKTIKVNLWLRVERNSKFVRGMKKSRQQIEDYCLSQYDMEKEEPDGWEYTLTIPYTTEEDLEATIYDIYDEMESIADGNNCWTESDISTLDGERGW